MGTPIEPNGAPVTVSQGTTLDIGAGGSASVRTDGAIVNHGVIALDPAGDVSLLLAGNTTLSGGGQVTLGGASNGIGIADGTTFTFENVDNTISGAGASLCSTRCRWFAPPAPA